MARSDWFRGLATKIGIFVAFIIAAVAIGWGWNYGLRHERIYEQEARQGYSDQSENGCYQIAQPQMQGASVDQANRKPCTPSEEAKLDNDSRRNYADLVAQRSSALWAKIMGIAALIGMGLSLVGVALVWTTFRETRKANEISRASQRPWLDASIRLHGISKVAIGFALRVEVIIENVGSTPANHVRCAVDGFFLDDVIGNTPFKFGGSRKDTSRAIKEAAARVNASNDLLERDGLTIFPNASESLYSEEVISVTSRMDEIKDVAWLVVGLRYFLGHKEASTVRVFLVKSFGLPNETGLDAIGEYGYDHTETNAMIKVWERGGYAD